MSFFLYAEVVCDAPGDVVGTCGNAFSDQGTVTQVRDRARQSGWSTGRPGGLDFCPGHRAGKRHEGAVR